MNKGKLLLLGLIFSGLTMFSQVKQNCVFLDSIKMFDVVDTIKMEIQDRSQISKTQYKNNSAYSQYLRIIEDTVYLYNLDYHEIQVFDINGNYLRRVLLGIDNYLDKKRNIISFRKKSKSHLTIVLTHTGFFVHPDGYILTDLLGFFHNFNKEGVFISSNHIFDFDPYTNGLSHVNRHSLFENLIYDKQRGGVVMPAKDKDNNMYIGVFDINGNKLKEGVHSKLKEFRSNFMSMLSTDASTLYLTYSPSPNIYKINLSKEEVTEVLPDQLNDADTNKAFSSPKFIGNETIIRYVFNVEKKEICTPKAGCKPRVYNLCGIQVINEAQNTVNNYACPPELDKLGLFYYGNDGYLYCSYDFNYQKTYNTGESFKILKIKVNL